MNDKKDLKKEFEQDTWYLDVRKLEYITSRVLRSMVKYHNSVSEKKLNQYQVSLTLLWNFCELVKLHREYLFKIDKMDDFVVFGKNHNHFDELIKYFTTFMEDIDITKAIVFGGNIRP